MITAKEAYEIIKESSKMPITYLIETGESFLSSTKECLSVSKSTGEVDSFYGYAEFIIRVDDGCKHVMLDEMFEDFMTFYKKNMNEKTLAYLYASTWNILYHHNNGCPDYYRDDGEKQEIIHRWSIIEQNLYADIRLIIDNEYIDYPPIVLNEFDDSFFSIKPFMIRNGWTTNNVCRTWVRSTENLRNIP